MKKFAILTMFFLLVTFLFGCKSSDQILAKKMIEKYSNNQNYVTLTGEVIEQNQDSIVIKCEELNDYLSYEDELCKYYIYSDEFLVLQVGEEIQFTTVPFHFYNGHRLPIVELKINENVLLSFEEGKENLIDWVNTTFK